MSIRAMTDDEIRRALRHGAEVCIETQNGDWRWYEVLPADGAFRTAFHWFDLLHDVVGRKANPEQAATFLLFAAEAHE
jgi:hypothetical protein